MATMSSLIGEGVPEKFPGLNFVFLEAGIGWVPYMMHRMNKIYRMRRSEVPLLEQTPEAYLRDQFYIGSQPLGEQDHPGDMKRIIETLGAEMLMFATDYPHWDFDHLEELDKYLQQYFTPEERHQILYDTPIEAFDLDL
jgi:predicted TIM-barrel fold metal-dependent hydrolase